MDAYEATKVVLQRIQTLDPENASKIMGFLLIQDHGEKEMIRLAFGPEALLQSVIVKARKELGLSIKSPPTPSTPPSPAPFGISVPFSRQNSSSATSSRLLGGVNRPPPLSIAPHSCAASASWAVSNLADFQISDTLISPSASTISHAPFYGGGEVDLVDEFQLQDQLSFLNDGSLPSGPKSPDIFYPQHQDLASSPNGLFPSYGGSAAGWGSDGSLPHRRSCSVNDICLGSDDPSAGFGWKPCLYFARGYCKNGTNCRFVHGAGEAGMVGSDSSTTTVGSPSNFEMMEQCQELLRSKSAQQQRLAAASQIVASSDFPYSPAATVKCMNFLLQQQHLQVQSPRAAAALMMNNTMHKLSRACFDRGVYGMNGGAGLTNPSSRQIYLTFPADSIFKEEDVSNYFSNFGPVQDVRIPYQQKRMFGFVTFVYPETVKIILAKGNPHFVCDSRVLVKPYKEKGKVPEKFRKQQEQMERGEFTGCGSPTGLESLDPYDLPLGARTFYNTQDMLWRRKLEEQADLQQTIELQSRRLMNLQFIDAKRSNHHRTHSMGAVFPSPTYSPGFVGQNAVLSTDCRSPEAIEENGSTLKAGNIADENTIIADKDKKSSATKDENGNGKESHNGEENHLPESLEHNLPDSPFASPRTAGDSITAFLIESGEVERGVSFCETSNNKLVTSTLFPVSASADMTSFNSCYFQMSRSPSGQGTIGM